MTEMDGTDAWPGGHRDDTRPPVATVFAHEVSPQGGMERAQLKVVEGLLQRGWRVRVVTCRLAGLEPQPRLEYHRLPILRRPFVLRHALYALGATLWRVRHGSAGVTTALGAIVPFRVDAITVQYVHAASSGARGALSWRGAQALGSVNRLAAGAVALWLERWCYRPGRVRALMAVSDRLRHEVATHYPGLALLTTTIPNGADPVQFRPDAAARSRIRAEVGLGEDRLVAAFIGGDWERKGLAVALEAVAASATWELLVVGNGDHEQWGAVAARLGIGDRVRFVAPVADTSPYFAAADAFVLPTRYEGFPLVCIEAAASALPVITTPQSNAAALVEHGVSGWLVPRDASVFAQCLAELAADPGRRAAISAASRERALRFDWREIAARHERIYAELLDRSAAARSSSPAS